MREVLSISLPAATIVKIKKTAKDRGYDSVSEYIQRLVIEDRDDIISEKELLKDIKSSESDYKKGKTRVLKSLRELL